VVKIWKAPAHRDPTGEIVEILGQPDDPGVAIAGIIKGSGWPESFPRTLTALLPTVPPAIQDHELAGREDLRHLDVVTIDGEDAKDFDDAVSLEKRRKGFRLGVHIADVSHYVTPREHLDQEAYLRATSVYLVDRVLPMLPEVYSNGICSLVAGQDRLTISVFMDVDDQGYIGWYKIVPSVVRVRRRLTYPQVEAMLKEEEPQYAALAGMKEAADLLYQRRLRDGSLDFDLPEAKVILGPQGKPEQIVMVPRLMAHRIIEEFMLAANETVAKHLSRLDVPVMFRVHEPPREEDLNAFRLIAHQLGIAMPKSKTITPAMLQHLLAGAKGKPTEYLVNTLMLRAMKLAVYTPVNRGHFGLAKTHYVHFTSPIRRYPDLIVHRLLRESWKPQPEQRWESFRQGMAEWAAHCSDRERLAEEMEEQTVKLKKLEFLASKVGEVFEGVVSGVKAFGIFVELHAYLVDGLIPTAHLPGGDYLYDEVHQMLSSRRAVAGRGRGKHQFQLGDPLRVKIARVLPARQQLDLVLA